MEQQGSNIYDQIIQSKDEITTLNRRIHMAATLHGLGSKVHTDLTNKLTDEQNRCADLMSKNYIGV